MIKLDNNYSIVINSTHGFELHYRGEAKTKEVTTKKGKVTKDITPTEVYYFPSISFVLKKYISLTLSGDNLEGLIESVENIESNVEKFSKTFAVNGKILLT